VGKKAFIIPPSCDELADNFEQPENKTSDIKKGKLSGEHRQVKGKKCHWIVAKRIKEMISLYKPRHFWYRCNDG